MIDPTRFTSYKDADQKLHESVLIFNGEPFYARCVPDSWEIKLYPLIGEAYKTPIIIFCDDPKLVIASPPLGFINQSDTECTYLSRLPTRNFKTGLCFAVATFTTLNGNPRGCPITNFPFDKSLYNTIKGIYPSIREILKKNFTKKTPWSQAFSRNYAIARIKDTLKIFHKTTPIAVYNTDTFTFECVKESNILIENFLNKYGIKQYAP